MEKVFDSDISETDAQHNQNLLKGDGKEANAGNVRVFSLDKVTVEKIVLESSNGSREVLLTKNESSRKFSLSSKTKSNVVKRAKDDRQKSTSNGIFSVPENAFTYSKPNDSLKTIILDRQSKLPIPKSRKSDDVSFPNEGRRIKPIKFIKNSSIGSIVIDDLNSTNAIAERNKVPPKVPEKSAIKKENNSSLTVTSISSTKELSKDLLLNREKVVDEILFANTQQEQSAEHKLFETEDVKNDKKNDANINCVELEKHNKISKIANVHCSELNKIEKQKNATDVENRRKSAKIDRDAQSCLEKSQATIEDLQKNLSTRIHPNTAQSYKEKLLGFQANYTPRLSVTSESSGSERLSSGFDKDFLEKHNLDKRLKIEEKRLLETDLDYTSDNDRTSETEDQPSRKIDIGQKYSKKVTEIEKRWSGEFLENRLQSNSSESSKSSYIEEFGSVSSRESIVEDHDGRLLFGQKHPTKFTKRQTSIDEPKIRTSEEILENSTVSTVDSDSCLEDRIKAVDEDIAHVTNQVQTDDNDDIDELDQAYDNEKAKDCIQWNEEINAIPTTAIVSEEKNQNLRKEKSISDTTGINNYNDTNSNQAKNNYKKKIVKNEGKVSDILLVDEKKHLTEQKTFFSSSFTIINSKESTDSTFVLQNYRNKDGYANLIKEFAMEAGSSKMKKEEKQKKKLGFRRLLPAIFSPKDSRKDYKKKEQKERRRYDERHFARYQQNGNYTRSPDTMNLNEDIKRNVKLDNSLNGSIIDERLDEIKRELFPEQGPITSTPDHFLQTDDTRLLCDRTKNQRSYTTDSSLSSIAPDERWTERGGQFVISPDIRKYEQRQKREEHDSRRCNYLERKHSLQESNRGNRNYFFQRNHGPSGRISAPPGERFLVRPRAIHLVDRPLPEIPQSRLELSNYENYQDGINQLCDDFSGMDVVDNKNYQNQSGLYQNDNNLETSLINTPQSVPAQVKITRQPIVNQIQKAPLIGRTSKYPSSGSSQKSGDYADSSCTPNSSQKSEFSPSSSKSGEYYLNSPRGSARTSPTERSTFEDERERIYENETQPVTSQSSIHYVEEHVYDETPSSPCREKHFSSTKASDHTAENSPEKKDNLIYEQKCLSQRQSPLQNSSFQHSCEDNENMQTESKREIEKLREDCLKNNETQFDINLKNDSTAASQAEKTPIHNVSPSKHGMTTAMSPSIGSRARRSQPNDQILIASPKRETICQSRISRPSNEMRLCGAESPIPIADSREGISGIVPIEVRHQYGSRNSPATGLKRSIEQKTLSSSGFSKGISRPEPIYGHRRQQTFHKSDITTLETKEDRRENNQLPPGSYSSTESCRDVDERVARVQNQSSVPQNLESSEAKQISDESERRTVQSPIRESTQDFCQQRQHDASQQRTLFATTLTSQQSSPTVNQDRIYTSASSLQHESIYEQRQRQYQPRQGQEPLHVQRIADATYGQQNHSTYMLLSPSKQETRQHLEAFYWQQKALEAHRKSAVSSAKSGPRQIAPKIDLPEMREAMYWQQLKKLDEEQQRRIYERNAMEDRLYETYKTRTASPVATSPNANQTFNSKGAMVPGLVHGDRSYWGNVQQHLKTSPTGKLPLMQIQKGQNQPVLIVRPQQALRDRQEMSMKSMNPRDSAGYDAQRSKSASPHFHRSDIERASFNVTCRRPATNETTGIPASPRKPEASEIHEEDSNDGNEDKPRPPHPIFKRGSLIGGDSVEYGSTGPKRVSFSNQPKIGPDLATGSWPTKHGTAPEPPTRRHKSENSSSDTDSVYLHQDRRDVNQDVASHATRTADSTCRPQREYDANRPLPPPPKDPFVISRRENTVKNYVCNEIRWNSEEQRSCQRRQGESVFTRIFTFL